MLAERKARRDGSAFVSRKPTARPIGDDFLQRLTQRRITSPTHARNLSGRTISRLLAVTQTSAAPDPPKVDPVRTRRKTVETVAKALDVSYSKRQEDTRRRA